jgi:hypothetical protein
MVKLVVRWPVFGPGPMRSPLQCVLRPSLVVFDRGHWRHSCGSLSTKIFFWGLPLRLCDRCIEHMHLISARFWLSSYRVLVINFRRCLLIPVFCVSCFLVLERTLRHSPWLEPIWSCRPRFLQSPSSLCLIADACRWKMVLFLSHRIQGSSFSSFLLCFHGGFSVTHGRYSIKFL